MKYLIFYEAVCFFCSLKRKFFIHLSFFLHSIHLWLMNIWMNLWILYVTFVNKHTYYLSVIITFSRLIQNIQQLLNYYKFLFSFKIFKMSKDLCMTKIFMMIRLCMSDFLHNACGSLFFLNHIQEIK